ncbi:MAG: MBL fold metallo-hydrolase [Desulfobacterales bacterium]|nr:MBL fold metallo-hydrolase [Desulfobacterales bacterium]
MKFIIYPIIIAALSILVNAVEKAYQKPYHHLEGGFRNLPGIIKKQSFSFDHLWFFVSRPFSLLKRPEIPTDHVLDNKIAVENFYQSIHNDSVTWVGHMTCIIKLDGQIILIDPWFTDYPTPIPPIGPKRVTYPGIHINQLPQINTVVISHNHYDHLDIPTLKQLPYPEKITIIVPLGISRYIEDINFKKVVELDWYESVNINSILYTALPAVHFSKRDLLHTNDTLWASFSIKSSKDKKVFFSEGDYGEFYKQIGEKYGPFDLAILSCGAYKPYKVMKGIHCTPEDCVQIGIDIKAKNFLPVHWGTVILGSENLFEPGHLFREEALKKSISDNKIWLMKIGETRQL